MALYFENMIYCNKCEYYRTGDWGYQACNHPYNLVKVINHVNSYDHCDQDPKNLNKNNNCNWFRLKIPFYKKIFKFLTFQKTTYVVSKLPDPIKMLDEESNIIKQFASGKESLKEEAIKIFYKYLNNPTIRGTIEMKFMSEVDNIVPDYYLKNMYRDKLLRKGSVKI